MSIYLRIHGTGSVCFGSCKESPTLSQVFRILQMFQHAADDEG